MGQHRELAVTGSRDAIARVATRLQAQAREQAASRPPGRWSLAPIREQGRQTDGGDAVYLILDVAGAPSRAKSGARSAAARPARVWLTVRGERARLANLFVQGNDELEDDALVEESNRVVVRLHDGFVEPAAAAEGPHVELGTDAPDLPDWMSCGTADLLRVFATTANRSTGVAHPTDRGRFFDFLLAAHVEGASLTAKDLTTWLHDEGWPRPRAEQAGQLYEFGRALLARQQS